MQIFSPPASKLMEEKEVTEGGRDGRTDRQTNLPLS